MAELLESPAPRSGLALKRWQFLLLTAVALLALGLVVLTTQTSSSISNMRKLLDERQTFINETMLLSRINAQLAQVLANLSINTNDEQLRKVLNDNGITFSVEASQGSRRANFGPGAASPVVKPGAMPGAMPGTINGAPR